jgi:hypothetical protein
VVRGLRQGEEGKSDQAIDVAEQPAAADTFQRPLRSRFQARLSGSVEAVEKPVLRTV